MSALQHISRMIKDVSISRKLLMIVALITNISLLVISIAVIVYDRQSAKSTLKEEMNVLINVIAKRSTAALAFEDHALARENLFALSEKSSIRFACTYNNNGELFAQYIRGAADLNCDSMASIVNGTFTDQFYFSRKEIVLDNTPIGSIVIATSLVDINNRLIRHIIVVSIIFILAGVIASLLWYFLQRLITRPIDELANISRRIYQEKDYSVRVTPSTNDEIGQLYAAFNVMLSGIQERDAALLNAKENLENLVRERTLKLEQAQKDLLKNERMATLGQLTATVSHEIRNPLGTIRTSVFTLANKIQKDPNLLRVIERIERNVVRCDSIITELLDFSRIRAIQHQVTNLSDWLIYTVEDAHVSDDIQIRLELDNTIEVEIDRDLLHRVMMNILDNASQAIADSQNANKDKTIIIQNRICNDRVEIIITDTGIGIPEDVVPRIFEPLFSTKGFGVGLGLPIVKQIMEQHGGGVSIKSEPHVGTQVTLWLPASLGMTSKQQAYSGKI